MLSLLLLTPVFLRDLHFLILAPMALIYALVAVPFCCEIYCVREWKFFKKVCKEVAKRFRLNLDQWGQEKIQIHLLRMLEKLLNPFLGIYDNEYLLKTMHQVQKTEIIHICINL